MSVARYTGTRANFASVLAVTLHHTAIHPVHQTSQTTMIKNAAAVYFILNLISSANAAPNVLFESAGDRQVFLPGESVALSSGWLIRDYRPTLRDATQFAAMPFALSTAGKVTGVELALTALASWSTNYSVSILPDSGGLPGSTAIWQGATLEAAPVYVPGSSYDLTAATGQPVDLLANTTYWLFVGCQGGCEVTWWADKANPTPGAIQYNSVFPYDLRWTVSEDSAAMFRIHGEVSAIPEPTSLALLCLGTALLAAQRRRDA
jgi:PEP-CTERM motif